MFKNVLMVLGIAAATMAATLPLCWPNRVEAVGPAASPAVESAHPRLQRSECLGADVGRHVQGGRAARDHTGGGQHHRSGGVGHRTRAIHQPLAGVGHVPPRRDADGTGEAGRAADAGRRGEEDGPSDDRPEVLQGGRRLGVPGRRRQADSPPPASPSRWTLRTGATVTEDQGRQLGAGPAVSPPMRNRWQTRFGVALGLLGTAVVVSTLCRPQAGPPPTGPILSDCDGALAELVVHYASAARPVVSSIYRDFFRQLRPGVTVHVVCPGRGGFRRAGRRRRTRTVPAPPGHRGAPDDVLVAGPVAGAVARRRWGPGDAAGPLGGGGRRHLARPGRRPADRRRPGHCPG